VLRLYIACVSILCFNNYFATFKMAHRLGKRKRITREELEQASHEPSHTSDEQESDSEDLQAIFRRAFEAKFKPIEIEPVNKKSGRVEVEEEEEEEEEKEEEDSDWSGINSENEGGVEVVEYTDTWQEDDKTPKVDLRGFMVNNILPISNMANLKTT
jgi:hypothetical protein